MKGSTAMQIAVFAKRRTTEEGKTFYSYLSTLTKKDGTKQTVAVKFRDEAGNPKPERCPMNVIIDKSNANLATREYVNEDTGEVCTSYTLWVSAWTEGAPYVDASLDDYDV